MKRSLKQRDHFPQYTTMMVRIVISGTKKQSSPSKKFFSVLWIIGAFLVIIVYVFIPVLIAFRQISNILLEVLLAASLLLIVELVISLVLLKIANPSRTPSLTPQRYQPPVPKLVQPKIPTTPVAKPNKSVPQFNKIRPFSLPSKADQPQKERTTDEIVSLKRLKLPSR